MEPEHILSPWHPCGPDLSAVAAALKGYAPCARGDLAHTKPPYREAAVLVPLIARDAGLSLLLTRRAAHLSVHAGQVSFPGGGTEEHDADCIATALREAEEEIGLDPKRAQILGVLDTYVTATGFRVSPVVAHVEPQDWRPDLSEVEEVFELPLLAACRALKIEERDFGYGPRTFHALTLNEYYVWGATAGMLKNLAEVMKI